VFLHNKYVYVRIVNKNSAFFAGLEYGPWTAYEFGSLTYTSVVVMLPLGTLAAQRLANPSAFSSPDDSKPDSSSSNKEPFLKSWHSATVSSRVESNSSSNHGQNNMRDDGFAKYEGADAEKGVRIARQIEHRQEMAM
jgi:pheromone alpha factor receptor